MAVLAAAAATPRLAVFFWTSLSKTPNKISLIHNTKALQKAPRYLHTASTARYLNTATTSSAYVRSLSTVNNPAISTMHRRDLHIKRRNKAGKNKLKSSVHQVAGQQHVNFTAADPKQDGKTDANCIFCKVLAGEVHSSTVYEDDVCSVILDIHPITKGHMLILPKQHYECIMSQGMRQEVSMHMMRLAHLITMGLTKHKQCDGTNLLMNNGAASWQTVPHSHLHVIPRRKGDSMTFVFGILKHVLSMMGLSKAKSTQELDELAAQMSNILYQEIISKQRL